jgi:hypothetical protein
MEGHERTTFALVVDETYKLDEFVRRKSKSVAIGKIGALRGLLV